MLIVDSTNYLPQAYWQDFGLIPEAFLPIGGKIYLTALCESFNALYSDTYLILPSQSSANPYSLEVLNKFSPEINIITPESFHEIFFEATSSITFVSHLAFPSGATASSTDSSQSFILRCHLSDPPHTFESFSKHIHDLRITSYSQDLLLDSFDLSVPANYFKLRAQLVNLRFFNSLNITDNVLTKQCSLLGKAQEEWLWYQEAKQHIPQYIPTPLSFIPPDSYSIEYYPFISLSEAYVFGNLSFTQWQVILSDLSIFYSNFSLLDSSHYDPSTFSSMTVPSLNQFVINKVYSRLSSFSKNISHLYDSDIFSLPISLNGLPPVTIQQLLDFSLNALQALVHCPFLFHGDLCLSNILYDSRLGTFKVIDPRGLIKFPHQDPSIISSQVYDMMKLCHSLLGRYDFINYGFISTSSFVFNKSLEISVDFSLPAIKEDICEFASSLKFDGQHSLSDYYPSTILLFLSMLPLHSDSLGKQLALLANAVHIYHEKHQ